MFRATDGAGFSSEIRTDSKRKPQYLAKENVNRESTARDVEDGNIPKKGSKFLCIHSG